MIPLGILSASSFAPGGVAAFDLLETQILTATAASVTFTGLGSYSDYKHLQIRVTARSTGTLSTGFMQMQANADTGNNYAIHALRGDGSSVTSYGFSGENRFFTEQLPNASDTANIFGAAVIDILDFSSADKNTTVRMLFGKHETASLIGLYSGLWNDTAAVTSLRLFIDNNFEIGSRFSLYGVK
jgi:hypothetical protein